jgi:hypothetical protein
VLIDEHTILRRQPAILTQQVEDMHVLLNVSDGQYYALNEIGSLIWQLCDGCRPIAAIVARLCEEYDAPAEQITGDVLALAHDFVEAQLVVVEEARNGTASPVTPD